MSSVTAPPRPGAAQASPAAPARDGLLAAVLALLAIYAAACLVYGFQAWQHQVPWLFQDEIFYASQAREYAATGELTIRGDPNTSDGLTARVTSIAWHFDDPETDYLAAKLLNVLLMAAACFPAYALARLVVKRGWALFAAAGTVAIPAFVYSSMILTEPLAYVLSTTALWLLVRALSEKMVGRRAFAWLLAALAVSFLASEARGQLGVLFIVIAVAAALRLVLSEPVRRRRPLFLLGTALFAVEIFGIYRVLTRPGSYAHDYMYEW